MKLRAGQTKQVIVKVARRDNGKLAKLSKATVYLVVVLVEGHSTRRYTDLLTIPR